MDPVIDHDELVTQLTSRFRGRVDGAKWNGVRLVGIVFARPSSPLAKAEIIPQLADWHHRSGDHVDFFFAGYTYPHPVVEGFVSVPVPGRSDWLYSSSLFNKFRQEMEHRTTWQYSGGCDLLLANVRFNPVSNRAELDLGSVIVCQLDSMKDDKAILSVESFFESIFRFVEGSTGNDPAWGFSDHQGLALAGSALKRVALSLLPTSLDAEAKKAEHFVIRDVGRRGA